MPVATTGSSTPGLVNGLSRCLNVGSGNNYNLPEEILTVWGNPDTYVTSIVGSQVAFDPLNRKLYMSLIANGSTWFNVGSRT
jgi:hypothetical protein